MAAEALWESTVLMSAIRCGDCLGRASKVFTGLVEETGTIQAISKQAPGARIAIKTKKIASDARLGDSIAVNGCCLTIVAMDAHVLTFEAIQETLQRTNLGQKQVGEPVNLERSLAVGDRLGGHFVTGHIDGPGRLLRTAPGDLWSMFWFEVAPELTRQMASKGSITVDGVSLTLVDVGDQDFSVALIPHTLAATTLGRLRIGDSVNLETDVLAKYVQRQLSGRRLPDDTA